MPRSSSSKSHNQCKHCSRECSDFDEDAKMKDANDSKENGVSIKVSNDSLVSGGKRKLGNDLSGFHENVNVHDEFATPTKRRKEKTHGGDEKFEVNSNLDDKNLKAVGESKSKTSRKHDVHNEWHVEEGSRNIELEKELEKRMRRRKEYYKDKDRYHYDVKEGNERILSTKSSRMKDINYKDEHGDNKYRETKHREDKSRDKKYKRETEKEYKHKNDKDRRRDNEKDEGTVCRTRNMKDQSCESEERSMSDDTVDQISVNHKRYRSSPNGKYHPTRDHHRVSKREETRSRDYNGNSNKDFTSAQGQFGKISSGSPDKITQKDDNNLSHLDNDNLSVSSPYTRNNRFSTNQTPFRTQTNWKNFPNWPFSLPNNNYIPYPPIFNPIMQQFPPPIFLQPPIYHESIPPLLHNWEANNSILRGHGRVDWENSRTQSKGAILSEQMDDIMKNIPEVMTVKKEDNRFISRVYVSKKNLLEAMKVKKEDESLISRVYLSKIDISEDLTQPDLYDHCTNMLGLDQASVSDKFDCKILFLEGGIEADVSNGALLYAAINNSVFKKAMSLYTKQRARNQEKGGPTGAKDSGDSCDGGKEVDKAADGGGCLFIELESVNISRIHHHFPKSTH